MITTIKAVGYKHTKEELLGAALDAALEDGLSQLTFGRLAKRLGTSDRVVVYYFPSKSDLVGDVVAAMGVRLQHALAPAFDTPAAGHLDLVRRAWPVLAAVEHDRTFALFFEANGLAAVGREPYATLVPTLVEAWIDWVAGLIEGAAERRRSEAEAAIAVIDGLLLLRQLAGPEAAERAAAAIGIQ